MGKSDKTRYLVSEAGFDLGAFGHDEAHLTAEVIDASASNAGRARPIRAPMVWLSLACAPRSSSAPRQTIPRIRRI
jgi:hypothetical protein